MLDLHFKFVLLYLMVSIHQENRYIEFLIIILITSIVNFENCKKTHTFMSFDAIFKNVNIIN